ncbi:hypothetical protein LCGC14_2547820 [marine sediment metagenome]|uniref:Inositol monophosphatase n=1 Tax=marine sediment metagenome TaxID=412755 RepID=A0A0F9APD2_9ZZZZ
MAGESARDLLELAVGLAEEAGKITLKYFHGRPHAETKADMTPVTVADREAEAYIRGAIESRFPDDGIIGEEFGETRAPARRRWYLGVTCFGRAGSPRRAGVSLSVRRSLPPTGP